MRYKIQGHITVATEFEAEAYVNPDTHQAETPHEVLSNYLMEGLGQFRKDIDPWVTDNVVKTEVVTWSIVNEGTSEV